MICQSYNTYIPSAIVCGDDHWAVTESAGEFTASSTLPLIVNAECDERLIEYEAQPSALLCLQTQYTFIRYCTSISGLIYVYGRIRILQKQQRVVP